MSGETNPGSCALWVVVIIAVVVTAVLAATGKL